MDESLDALVSCAVRSRTVAAQPAAPAEGDLHLPPPGATGADWATAPAGSLMPYANGVWTSLQPPTGLVAYVVETSHWVAFTVYDAGLGIIPAI